jgi:hypothetical protein
MRPAWSFSGGQGRRILGGNTHRQKPRRGAGSSLDPQRSSNRPDGLPGCLSREARAAGGPVGLDKWLPMRISSVQLGGLSSQPPRSIVVIFLVMLPHLPLFGPWQIGSGAAAGKRTSEYVSRLH